jgi:DNA-binding SARP family transcriptional activator/tetratricopeptide (TPR) repeat protein
MGAVRFAILGPLSVTDDGRDVPITAGRDRVVLAMLLLRQGLIVSANDLIDAVWAETPPATARGQLQTCVSRLRRMLPSTTIQTHPEGYGVKLGADELDAITFTRLIAEARAEAAPDGARARLRAALDLWRGAALAGIDSRPVRQAAAVLDEQYAAVVEDWIDLELERGRARDLLAELTGLVERFPLRERLRAQLMVALSRVGRQADALTEYRRGRDILRAELGIDPSAVLQEVHRRLLTGDAEAAPGGESAPPEPVRAVSALPRAVGDFTGRAGIVERIRRPAESASAAPHVAFVDGMAGSGKTTVAVHVAGLLRPRFPDAQLFIDLQGHSTKSPIEPAAAMVTLLRQLGVPADRIPDDAMERARLWQGAIGARRAVVVLDNAASTAQVTPLLPTYGAVVVLITSRRRLAGLDGVTPQSVPVLTESEAALLFTRIVGDRAIAEPGAVAEVVRRCGLLPLAIRLAGSRLAHRPGWRVTDLVRRLGAAALPGLAAEDRTVAAAFALSYGQLPAPQQRMFRMLGLLPGDRFSAEVAAALADLPLAAAEDLVDGLVDVHLVEEPERGRFRLHDLLREYAGTLVEAEPEDLRRAAMRRLFDHVLHQSAALSRSAETPTSLLTARFGDPGRPDLLRTDLDAAAFIDQERTNLLAVSRSAEACGEYRYVWLLARAAWRMWFQQGYFDDMIDAFERGLAAARAAGDDAAVGVMANYLASGYHRVARIRDAASMLALAHEFAERAGDRVIATAALSNLGIVHIETGDIDAAERAVLASLADRRRRQDLPGLGVSLSTLGLVADRRQRHQERLLWHRRSLQLCAEIGATVQRNVAFSNVAITRSRLGHPVAERMLLLAISLNIRVDRLSTAAGAMSALGVLLGRQGRFAEAFVWHRRALDGCDETNERRLLSEFRVDLGKTLYAAGDRAAATEEFRAAAALAAAGQNPYEEGRGLVGLADCLAPDDPELARSYRERGEVMFAEMGVPVPE